MQRGFGGGKRVVECNCIAFTLGEYTKKNMSAVFRQRARENGRAHYLVVSFVQDGVCVCVWSAPAIRKEWSAVAESSKLSGHIER